MLSRCSIVGDILTPVFANHQIWLKQQNLQIIDLQVLKGIVGMAGFEPAASTSQMWRDTGLRYIPKGLQIYVLLYKSQIKV